ncbi:MAG: hypothetical protein QM731_09580 [Chitinophagaceae bacterium]
MVKWVLIVVGTGLLLFVGYVFTVFFTFSFDDGKHYSIQDLIDNYNARTEQVNDLKNFINSNVPVDKSVVIEFDGNKGLSIFHIIGNGTYDSNWDLKIKSSKVDTLLNKLGWTHQTLKTLKDKLDAANCISFKNGDPCNIGFQRSGMGEYFYDIFDKPIPDSLKSHYNDSCTYIIYRDKVVLEYGGGAIGPQCFQGKIY